MLLHFSLFEEPGFRVCTFFSIDPTLTCNSTGLSLRFQILVPNPDAWVWSRHPSKQPPKGKMPNPGIFPVQDSMLLITFNFESTGILLQIKDHFTNLALVKAFIDTQQCLPVSINFILNQWLLSSGCAQSKRFMVSAIVMNENT